MRDARTVAARYLTDGELLEELRRAEADIDAAYWRFCRCARAKPPVLEVPAAYQRRTECRREASIRRLRPHTD